MSNKKNKLELPTILTYIKSIQTSQGVFKSVFDFNVSDLENDIQFKTKDVLIEHAKLRTTQSNYLADKDIETKAAKTAIQETDFAYLDPKSKWLNVNYNVNFSNQVLSPYSCNSKDVAEELKKFVESYLKTIKLTELLRRYVFNIIAAKTMWRNKKIAEECIVKITCEKKSYIFNVNLTSQNTTEKELSETDNQKLNEIVSSLEKIYQEESDETVMSLSVENYLKIGFGQEVYPSQEFIEDSKSKVLSYTLNEKGEKNASYHAAKIGNAIRQIDDWYNDNDDKTNDVELNRLAIEPYAPDLLNSIIYRDKNNNFYKLLSDYVLEKNQKDEEGELIRKYEKVIKENNNQKEINDLHFIFACLIRGGVYNSASKKKE